MSSGSDLLALTPRKRKVCIIFVCYKDYYSIEHMPACVSGREVQVEKRKV